MSLPCDPLPTLESIAVFVCEVEKARHENRVEIKSQPMSYRHKLKKNEVQVVVS